MVECLITLWMVFKWILSPWQCLPSSFHLSSSSRCKINSMNLNYCAIKWCSKNHLPMFIYKKIHWWWRGWFSFQLVYPRWKLNVKEEAFIVWREWFPLLRRVVFMIDVWPLLLCLSFSIPCKELETVEEVKFELFRFIINQTVFVNRSFSFFRGKSGKLNPRFNLSQTVWRIEQWI